MLLLVRMKMRMILRDKLKSQEFANLATTQMTSRLRRSSMRTASMRLSTRKVMTRNSTLSDPRSKQSNTSLLSISFRTGQSYALKRTSLCSWQRILLLVKQQLQSMQSQNHSKDNSASFTHRLSKHLATRSIVNLKRSLKMSAS